MISTAQQMERGVLAVVDSIPPTESVGEGGGEGGGCFTDD